MRNLLCTLILLVLLASAARAEAPTCAVPAELRDGWQGAGLDESDFDAAALCGILGEIAAGDLNVHAVLIERRGRLIAELYKSGKDRSIYTVFPREVSFGPADVHDLRSVSKSIVGLLLGIAMQQQGNRLALSTPALDFYPELADLRDARRDAITLEHLLTMSSGLEWHESVTSYGSLSNDETRLYWDWDPARFVLSRPIAAAAGSAFNYNGGSTAVLADILVRTTKKPLRELAREALFAPLGIEEWEWVGDLYRRPIAYAGLRMRPRDLLKIGRMVLDRGQAQGRQIVPAEWLAQSLRPHIAAANGLEYGYHWWAGSAGWRGMKSAWGAGFGNGGQRLFVVPDLDLAVVITAGAYNDPTIAAKVNELFRRIVAAVGD